MRYVIIDPIYPRFVGTKQQTGKTDVRIATWDKSATCFVWDRLVDPRWTISVVSRETPLPASLGTIRD